MRTTRAVAAGLAAVLVCSFTLSGCGGADARRSNHMERGNEYFAQGNYDKARVEFRNALQVAPNDVEARFMTARVAEKLGNLNEAAQLYQATIDDNPENYQARAALGRLYVFSGVPEKAKELVEPALVKHPDDPALLTVRGAARVQLKDREGALADAQKALRIKPDDENAAALLASLYRQSGEPGKAAELINSTLERVPKSVDLRQVLASLYATMGEQDLAEEQLRKVIEQEPKELRYRAQLVGAYLGAKKVDQAEQVLLDAIKAMPDNSAAKIAYVDFLSSQRTPERAMAAMRDFVTREPKNYELQFGLGALQQRYNRTDDALVTYNKILAANKEGVQAINARLRIAAIDVAARRFDNASRLVAEVIKENPRDNDALILRGNIALEKNDPAAAIADLRAVLRDQPRAVGLLRTLARAHIANGEAALAEESLRTAMEAAPADTAVRVELGQLLSQSGRGEQAVALLEEAVKQKPDSVPAREALVRAYIAANDLESARRAAEDLKLAGPTLATGPFLSGMVAYAQHRYEDAQRELDKALELQPNAMDALTAITRLDIDRGRTPQAVARLQARIAADPKNPLVSNMLGEVFVGAKEPAKAVDVLSQTIQTAPKWWLPYRNLALAKLAQKDQAGAVAAYETGIQATNHQPTLMIDLAGLYEQLGRVDDAIKQYEDLHQRNPRLEVAANNLAMLLITYRKDQSSLDRARDLSAPFATSNVGAYLDTHGWVRFKRGEVNQALPVLERAAAQSPNSKVLLFHLGMAQYKAGDRDRAIHSLERALDGGAKFSGADEARTTLATLKGSARG